MGFKEPFTAAPQPLALNKEKTNGIPKGAAMANLVIWQLLPPESKQMSRRRQ